MTLTSAAILALLGVYVAACCIFYAAATGGVESGTLAPRSLRPILAAGADSAAEAAAAAFATDATAEAAAEAAVRAELSM